MNKKFKLIAVLLVFSLVGKLAAQQLLTPSLTYSHKKTAYITLTDGTEIKGLLDDLNRKKGLISQVKIKDESGKLYKLTPDKIKYMYLAPSGLDKVGKAMDLLTDATKWNDEKLDQDLIKQGYVYIEQSEVMLKKKKMVLLMQLLNPTSSKEVKIYHDPMAKETASVGIGGINVAGGDAKSYFVKKGNGVAVKLEKKDYKKSFKELWGDCADMMSKYGDNPKWLDLAKHALEYCECKK